MVGQILKEKYTCQRDRHVFLPGGDAYALRCAFLHEGGDDISEQRAREMITKFRFIEVPKGWMIHLNQNGNQLQLQVDIFCDDLCEGVAKWIENTKGNAEIYDRLRSLMMIETDEFD